MAAEAPSGDSKRSRTGRAVGLRLSAVGFCGVDDSVNHEELCDLSAQHPEIEWGILIKPEVETLTPRYPSAAWLDKLTETRHRRGSPFRMRLAAHFCGSACEQLCFGDSSVVQRLCRDHGVQRIQVNPTSANGFNGKALATDPAFLDRVVQGLRASMSAHEDVEFILQVSDETKPLADRFLSPSALSSKPPNLAVLFDPSNGMGIVGERPPPIPSVNCGYAGGMGPETIEKELGVIRDVVGSVVVWIDMESKIRTIQSDGRDFLDFDKCRTVLKIVSESGVVIAPPPPRTCL